MWDTIRAGEIWQGEITNQRKDGSLYIEEQVITPVLNDQGEVFRFIAMKQDISERKKAQAREDRRRMMLEKVLDLGKTVTQITDLTDCLRHIHQSIQIELGFDRVGIFLYEESTSLIRGVFSTNQAGEIVDTSRYTQKASDSEAWLNALSNPMGITFLENYSETHPSSELGDMVGVKEHVSLAAWAGEKPMALISADNSITHRKINIEDLEALQLFAGYAGLAIENARWNAELEARVADRTAELETANQELQSFTYTIAHDLRAPARAMIGFSGLLDETLTGQVELDPISRNYLTRVHNGAKRMGKMIDELLEYTRLGRTPLRQETIDMNALVNQLLIKFKHTLKGRDLEITFDRLPDCEGDSKLIEQVWSHLLDNAIKFSEARPTTQIKISTGMEKDIPYYKIEDKGIGFDMKYLHKIFGVFQRLHIEDDFEGTGMGLALAERIIERHGGRIWAVAEPDRGAAFSFTLAAKPQEKGA
ncbi:MAG: hypothetical protein HC806_00520 [Anaerolineae bacterium]|nr:hypothetical protein [Anaerolineae bacterium]